MIPISGITNSGIEFLPGLSKLLTNFPEKDIWKVGNFNYQIGIGPKQFITMMAFSQNCKSFKLLTLESSFQEGDF